MKRYIYSALMFPLVAFSAPSQKEFLQQFIKPGDLVFDVGALLGKKADLFLECNPRKIICIEPQNDAVEYLQRKYHTDPRISIEHIGCANKEGIMNLSFPSNGRSLATFSKEWQTKGRYSAAGKDPITAQWDKTISVQVTTLDKLIEKYGIPAFCKIDVENFEYELLQGLSYPIPTLCFEFHREMLHNTAKCIHHLKALGYKKFNFIETENYQNKFALPDWVPGELLIKEILTHARAYHIPDLYWGDIYAQHTND